MTASELAAAHAERLAELERRAAAGEDLFARPLPGSGHTPPPDMPRCRHCFGGAARRRGLCHSCYRSRSIRLLYPKGDVGRPAEPAA